MKKYFEFNKPFLKFLPLFIIMLSLVFMLSSSYAIMLNGKRESNNFVMNVSNLEVTFIDNKDAALVLENAYPMSNTEGINQTKELVFQVKNKNKTAIGYDIYIDTNESDDDLISKIKFVTKKDNKSYDDVKILSQDNYVVRRAELEASSSNTYRIKAWLDQDLTTNDYTNKTYKFNVIVKTNQIG